MRLAITQPPLILPRSNHLRDPFSVVIHAHPHHLILIDHVSHIAVDKEGIEGASLFILHEDLLFLADDAHLLIIIQDEEISCLLQIAEIVVKFSFEFGVPGL